MTRVGTGADAGVAVFNHRQNVIGIPHFVIRIVGTAWMIMKPHHDIELLHHLLDRVDRVDRFCRDRPQPDRFREPEELSRLRFILGIPTTP